MWKSITRMLRLDSGATAGAPILENVKIQSSGTAARHAENPRWDVIAQAIYWIDMPAGVLHQHSVDGQNHQSWKLAAELGALAVRNDGRVLIATANELHWFDAQSGSLELWRTIPDHDLKTRRFNEAVWAPDGSLWLISMTLDGKSPVGSLLRVTSDSVDVIARDLIIGNGPAFDANLGRAYFADSHRRTIYTVDLSNPGVPAPFTQFHKSEGHPDGMIVDALGRLWVAHYDGAMISCWNSASQCVGVVRLPGQCPTALAMIPDSTAGFSAAVTTSTLRNMQGGLLFVRAPASFVQG